ncbi:MAG: hypothetical protein ABWZ82_11000 [Candidatus Limnocylindrales bacterium]
MDHAEVLERIEAAIAGPGGLARLGADASPEAVAVREHIAGCPPCAAEWRAWSVVSLGLAAAAPDTIEPRPELRERVLAAAAARPHPAASVPAPTATRAPVSPAPDPAPAIPPARSGIRIGPRRQRDVPATPLPATAPAGLSFRWLLLGAAAVVVLLVAGMVVGRQLVSTPEAPRGDPGRILAEAATILQGGGFGLARLETPEGEQGGVVVVSPGSGRLAVVSGVLAAPPEGERYVCLLDRDGTVTQVGYMRWEATPSGGSLAYWAGDAEPPDLGLPGDVFIVQLDSPGAQPALTGEFQG